MDVIPGRYTTLWFTPTKPGRYHLFCTEYCGAEHSRMIGWVTVMEPEEYEAWLAGAARRRRRPRSRRAQLFGQLACDTCHKAAPDDRGPALAGVFGSRVALASGDSVTADEGYLRESILNPGAKVVAGYQPIMPTFQGQVERRGAAAADLLHQEASNPSARPRRRRSRPRESHDERPRHAAGQELPQRHVRAEVVAADARPQADRDPLPDRRQRLLRARRGVRDAGAARAADAGRATWCRRTPTTGCSPCTGS